MHAFRAEETMTKEEAEEVVRRFQETASASRPRVADVAEALNTTPEEVSSLLNEVRGQTPLVPVEKPAPRRRRFALAGAALLLGSGLWIASHYSMAEITGAPTIAVPDSPTVPATSVPVRPSPDLAPTTDALPAPTAPPAPPGNPAPAPTNP